jgi:hypothetical protein
MRCFLRSNGAWLERWCNGEPVFGFSLEHAHSYSQSNAIDEARRLWRLGFEVDVVCRQGTKEVVKWSWHK